MRSWSRKLSYFRPLGKNRSTKSAKKISELRLLREEAGQVGATTEAREESLLLLSCHPHPLVCITTKEGSRTPRV